MEDNNVLLPEDQLPEQPDEQSKDLPELEEPGFDLYAFIDLKMEDMDNLDKEGIRQLVWGKMRTKLGITNEVMQEALSNSLIARAEEITLDIPNIAPYGDYDKLIENNDEITEFLKTEAHKPNNWESYGFSCKDMLTDKALVLFHFWNTSVDQGDTLEGTVFVSKYGKIKHVFPQYSD